MTRTPFTPLPPASGAPDDEGELLALLGGSLEPGAVRALEQRLSREPLLAERLEGLRRERAAFAALVAETPEQGLAQRLALRVRDQVEREERSLRRERVREGWSRRTWVRIVVASIGVHVLVLGLVLWQFHGTPAPRDGRTLATGWQVPEEGGADGGRELETPLDLPLVVAKDWVSDALLESHGLAFEEDGLPIHAEPQVRVAEHPYEVQFPMLIRTRALVKSKRLARVGLDANGTLTAVRLGLDALAARQSADGSFAVDATVPAASRLPLGRLGVTGLALLPFLAEGRCSLDAAGPGGDVVRRGVAWIRSQVDAGSAGDAAAADLSLAVLALSEDYMLAYGRWTADEAREQAQDLRRLGERLSALQTPDGAFPGAGEDPATALWPALALDAVAHTGVAGNGLASTQRLQRWFAALPRAPGGLPSGGDGRADALLTAGAVLLDGPALPAGPEALAAGTAMLVRADVSGVRGPLTAVAAGLALYRRDPAAFRTWNQTQGVALLARLSPVSGVAQRGDAVADTALILLALQSAYRAY